MIAWGRLKDIQAQVANVPRNWLDEFARKYPQHIYKRKEESSNSTMLYRSSGVLEAIEAEVKERLKDSEGVGDGE